MNRARMHEGLQSMNICGQAQASSQMTPIGSVEVHRYQCGPTRLSLNQIWGDCFTPSDHRSPGFRFPLRPYASFHEGLLVRINSS